MRNEALHGFVLHQRPYRENSRLVTFLSMEAGRVDGVARQQIPSLYHPILLFASGRSALKSFSKVETTGMAYTLLGDALFAGFYLNELLVRLLPQQEPMPEVVLAYGHALQALVANEPLIPILRRFELVLLAELGAGIDFSHDGQGNRIHPDGVYRYLTGEGFHRTESGDAGQSLLEVTHFLANPEHKASPACFAMLTRVLRVALAAHLGDQPLKSRALWAASRGGAAQ